MIKQETVNTFHDGMIMDLNPLVTPNNVITNALNATLVTFNGNENALQCDMGNGRVETAYLPEGYVPIGTTELGGIIYIVSYNPLIDKCQIGSFPSPERSIFQTSNGGVKLIDCKNFYSNRDPITYQGVEYYFVNNYSQKIQLSNNYLNPGDKYQIIINDKDGNSIVSSKYDVLSAFNQSNYNTELSPKYLKLNVVSISDNGKMNNLNDTLIWYEDKSKKYYMRLGEIQEGDIDEYRDLIKSNYNTFQSKLKGNLGIVAQLECINSFDIAWDAEKDGNNWNIKFLTNWTYDNESSRNSINLYGIYYSDGKSQNIHIIDNYPQLDKDGNIVPGNTDILNGERVFLDPNHNNDITKIRQNDGTDSQFIIAPGLKESASNPENDKILDINIMPVMPYGIIKWLERNIRINISKLGTGEISLIQYKYFVGDQNIQFNYGLEAYPELNKQVKGVTISFYEIDDSIQDNLILNWPIDTSRVIAIKNEETNSWESSWEKGSINTPNLSNAKYVIENNGQASYSGYFSEKFSRDNLDLNYIYLTEISINYNNEKNIKYYRIFYNSDIFNDYYYNVDDFKDIKLEEVVSNNIKYNFDIVGQNNTTNSEWSTQPDKYKGSSSTEYKDYYIHGYVSEDISGYLTAKINDVFDIKVSTTVNTINRQIVTSFESQQSYITNSNTNIVPTLKPITLDSSPTVSHGENNDMLNLMSDIEFGSNVKINYTNQFALNIGYELNPLSCTYRWLVYKGNDTSQMFYLYTNIKDLENEGYVKDEYGDESRYEGSFRKYCPNIYNELSDLLDRYDIVVLPTTCAFKHWSSDSGDKETKLGYGINRFDSINKTKKYKYSEWIADNPNCLMLYAAKTLDGDIHIFTFDNNENTSYIGAYMLSVVGIDAVGLPVSQVETMIQLDMESNRTNPYYISPLRGYYVPQQYVGDEYIRYSFGTIVYYPSVICKCSQTMEADVELFTKFNNNLEFKSKDFNGRINNLYFNPDRHYQVQFDTQYSVDNSDLINLFTQTISESYNIAPYGLVKIPIGGEKVYNYNCEQVKLISNYWSDTMNIPIVGQYSNGERLPLICTSNGRFRIKNVKNPDYKYLNGVNENGKQYLYLNNIAKLPRY